MSNNDSSVYERLVELIMDMLDNDTPLNVYEKIESAFGDAVYFKAEKDTKYYESKFVKG